MNTHKQSPQQIARAVLADNEEQVVKGDMTLESLIMLGIAAYNDKSNQRPENLSEACRRLGVNLHWVDRRDLAERYELYFGLNEPLSRHTHEQPLIVELEMLRTQYPDVPTWVKAAG